MDNSIEKYKTNGIPESNANRIFDTYSYGVVYAYTIPDESHKGRVKIGSATYDGPLDDPLNPTVDEQEGINEAAKKRINQQTKTTDTNYHLEYAYISITKDNKYFNDHTVHNILKRSGYERKSINTKNEHSEWFEITPALANEAILAAIDGKKALSTAQITAASEVEPIELRPSQEDAIARTIKAYSSGRKSYLWNAKMRFGKTMAAMVVAKELNNLNPRHFKKILIVTHRPNVNTDWYNDFQKVFCEKDTKWEYSSKDKGDTLKSRLEKDKPFIYFASLQDLRLSKTVVDDREKSQSQAKGFDKNEEVFNTEWDMVIVDEAHEGTQSQLGDATFSKIHSNFTLQLSGTPFNILHKFEDKEIYTWDYVMEQDEKIHWDERHPGKPNPYAELPSLSMLTYEIDKYMGGKDLPPEFTDAMDGAFNFHEMFRVERDEDGNEIPEFVHSEMVDKFLNLLVDEKHNFPYSTEEYRNYNKHTMWLLPNRTQVIKAMENKLKQHPVFSNFGIVNISGNMHGDDEQDSDAKRRVEDAIKNNDYTVTLTGQRLTVGASIKQWTAVLMMSDTDRASTYLQAAFRCQTPSTIDGRLKTHGYIFDFAPDRTLKLVAEAIEINHRKTTSPEQKEAMKKFLNFCPIIAATDGSMKEFSVSAMLEQLKNAIIERVRRNGFDDPKLYNDELLKLTELEIKRFNDLKEIVGTSTKENLNEIPVNEIGLDDPQIQADEETERKPKKELSEEEKERLRKLREAREQKRTAISILRGISIRMPMLVYGAINDVDGTPLEFDEDISLSKFVRLVDDESWTEFMPEGLTKEKFKDFIKYYDEDVFRGVTKSIRAKAYDCDELLPYDRVQAISEIFSSFKNPDKETVLTPWKVVNMHISSTLGGYDFNNTSNELEGLPEFVEHKPYSDIWSSKDTAILEINSKSGLYPLLATYNIYQSRLPEYLKTHNHEKDENFRALWNEILEKQVFVLCKTPMAKTITERTLAGYTGAKVNVVYINDLTKKLRKVKNEEIDYSDYSLKDELCDMFNIKGGDMKFTAVVGNPPYSETVGKTESQAQSNTTWIYQYFQEAADKLGTYTSLIYPFGGWFDAPNSLNGLGNRILKDGHTISIDAYESTTDRRAWYRTDRDPSPIFGSSADLSAGVSIVFRDLDHHYQSFKYTNRIYSDETTEIDIDNDESIAPNPAFISINNKLTGRKLNFRIKKGIFGIESDFVEKHPDKVSFEKNDWTSPIRLLTNDKSGSTGRATMFWADRTILPKGEGFIDKYKVIMTSAYPKKSLVSGTPTVNNVKKRSSELIEIMEKESAFGASRIAIFMSDNKKECENFLKYTKTNFFAALMLQEPNRRSTFGFVIPDQDFSDNSDINWDKPIESIDKQLFEKYGITAEEQKVLGVE